MFKIKQNTNIVFLYRVIIIGNNDSLEFKQLQGLKILNWNE